MSTPHPYRRPSPLSTRAALATAAITALAIAAPVAQASAGPPPAVSPPASAAAIGPTLDGDIFNGHTAIVTSPSSTVVTVAGPHH
jgi:hypothetical protein